MRPRLVVLSFALVGCVEGQSAPPGPPPVILSVSAVDGGETRSPGTVEASAPEQLERVVAASIAMLEGYEKRCERSALVSSRAMGASLYADRDEIELRNRRPQGGWEDRDVPTWLHQAEARQRELRRLTAEPCPSDSTP